MDVSMMSEERNYSSNSSSQFVPRYGWFHVYITLTILLIFTLCTIVGNVFVVAAILLEKNLQNVSNCLVISLAVADLMVAALVMPLSAIVEVSEKWWLGIVLCDLYVCFDVFCCTASILHLVAIALDRYWAVTNVNYIYQRTGRRIGLILLLVWSSAIVISIPSRTFSNRETKECGINDTYEYTIFSTVGSFYLPMCLLGFIYARIYVVARRRIRRMNRPRNAQGGGGGVGHHHHHHHHHHHSPQCIQQQQQQEQQQQEHEQHQQQQKAVVAPQEHPLPMKKLPKTQNARKHLLKLAKPSSVGPANVVAVSTASVAPGSQYASGGKQGGENSHLLSMSSSAEGGAVIYKTRPSSKKLISAQSWSKMIGCRSSVRPVLTSSSHVQLHPITTSCHPVTAADCLMTSTTSSGGHYMSVPDYDHDWPPNELMTESLTAKSVSSWKHLVIPFADCDDAAAAATTTAAASASGQVLVDTTPHHTVQWKQQLRALSSSDKLMECNYDDAGQLCNPASRGEESEASSQAGKSGLVYCNIHAEVLHPCENAPAAAAAVDLPAPDPMMCDHKAVHIAEGDDGETHQDSPATAGCGGTRSAAAAAAAAAAAHTGTSIKLANHNEREKMEIRRERKAALTLAIITGCFLLCWLPFFINALVIPFCKTCEPHNVVKSCFLWLGYFNSILNPVIYTIFSPEFRNAFRKILFGRYNKKRQRRGA